MTIVQALILGIIQGVTELLPISSTAHLIIIPNLFGWAEHPLVFDTSLHLGTALALLLYFGSDILNIIKGFISDLLNLGFNFKNYSDSGKLGIKIILGSIPAGIIGVIFGDTLEATFRGITWVALFLLLGSLLMFLAQKNISDDIKNPEDVSYQKSFFIGIFQVLALLPGFSRSGSTISGALLMNLNKETSAKYSFLLSVPIVFAAGIFQGISSRYELNNFSPEILLTGLLSSFIISFISIRFLMKFLKNHGLDIFIWYRLVVAVLLLLL